MAGGVGARARRCRRGRPSGGRPEGSGRGEPQGGSRFFGARLHFERRNPSGAAGGPRGAGTPDGVRGVRPEPFGEKGVRHERPAPYSEDSWRASMLTMLEEVVLLAVDERTGCLRSTREFGTAYALVGAVFFDLALERRIDTDTEAIRIIDHSPTGNATLDRVLA